MNATIDEILLLAGGVSIAAIGIARVVDEGKLRKTGIKVDGTVVENVYRSSSNGNGTYAPMVRYLTVDNQWITKKYEFGSNPPMYNEGDTVKVIYSPGDHEYFMIDSGKNKMIPVVMIALGVCLTAGVGIYYLLNQY
jgi:hypothetical protein